MPHDHRCRDYEHAEGQHSAEDRVLCVSALASRAVERA